MINDRNEGMRKNLFLALIVVIVMSIIHSSCFAQDTIQQKPRDTTIIKQVKPYLMFPGTCRQALKFYKQCFNGTIVMMQTFGQSSIKVPEELENRIFNAELRAGNLRLMASDYLPNNEVAEGSNFALFVVFSDKAEKEKIFAKLSEDGTVLYPIEDNFGMVMDKFGIQWMVESRE